MERKTIIPYPLDKCCVCGTPYPQIHHAIGGSRRKNSDEDGLLVPLCGYHHGEAHKSEATLLIYKRFAETCWIEERMKEGLSEEEALRRWIRRYCKNYL